MISTNITIDQIKNQLPVFSGQSSVTLIDALETYRTQDAPEKGWHSKAAMGRSITQ